MDPKAIEAALQIARRHGLTNLRATVLHDHCNLILLLEPGGLVARVATTTAEIRGADNPRFLAREVALGLHLSALGAPTVPPAEDVPPGPHESNGYWVTCWRHLDHSLDLIVAPAAVGHSLRQLHAALASFEGDLPIIDPLGEALTIADRLERAQVLPARDAAVLRASCERLLPAYRASMETDTIQPLHGDAHAGNFLRTPEGPIWTDFEDTGRGPVAWDLACLAARSQFWGPRDAAIEEALAAYGMEAVPSFSTWLEIRALFVLAWTAANAASSGSGWDRFQSRLEQWHTHERGR